MKIYTNKIDVAKPAECKFWTAPHSDYAFGVKLVKDGTAIGNSLSVYEGDTKLAAEASLVDGYTVFKKSSSGTGSHEFTVRADGLDEAFKIVNVVTDSSVFETSGEGGGSSYTLPEASETTLGGVKIPESGLLYIDDGVIDANVTNIGNSMFSAEGNGIVFNESYLSFGLDWENGQEWTFTMEDGTEKTFMVIAQERT